MVRQPKGHKHIRMIRRRMMRLWKSLNFEKGMRDDCLLEVLKRHRQKVEIEILKNRNDVESIVREQKEFSYSSGKCDNNGWIG